MKISDLFVSIRVAGSPIPKNYSLADYKQSLKVGDIVTAQSFDDKGYHTYKIRLDEDNALRVVTEGSKTCVYASVALGSDTDTLQLSQDETNALILTWIATQTKDGKGGAVANSASILVYRNNIPYKVTLYLKEGLKVDSLTTANIMVLTNAPYMDDTRVVGKEAVTLANGKLSKWRVDNKAVLDDKGNLKEGAKLISALPRMSLALPKRSQFTSSVSVAGSAGELIAE